MVMKSMSIDLMDEGIGVLLLHPGRVQTDMGGPDGVLTVTQSVQGKINLSFIFSGQNNYVVTLIAYRHIVFNLKKISVKIVHVNRATCVDPRGGWVEDLKQNLRPPPTP